MTELPPPEIIENAAERLAEGDPRHVADTADTIRLEFLAWAIRKAPEASREDHIAMSFEALIKAQLAAIRLIEARRA